MSLFRKILDILSVPELAIQTYQELLPYIEEAAGNVVQRETEAAIAAIVISEVGDNDTALQYIESFKIDKIANNKHQVRFVATSERIRSMEIGIKPFSIKHHMLSTGRSGVKFSKDGFLYRTVPISKDTSEPVSNRATSKEKEIRKKIDEILAQSKFAFRAALTNKKTGEYNVSEAAPGMMRYSVYDNRAAYESGKKSKRSRVVVFRTMSNRPGTSEWWHPGTKGRNIESKIEKWLFENEQQIFSETMEQLITDR